MGDKKKIGLFVEDYRPQTLEEYIGNDHVVDKVREYISEGNKPPHLLLYGQAGTGKTSLAKIIANETNSDLKYINASDENGIEAIRVKVKNFASMVSFSDFKLIILDEADYITPQGQAALRNVMEEYSQSTRFILTCNFVEKVIDPIQSRCTCFEITPPSQKEVAKKMVEICKLEGIEFDVMDIKKILDSTYPDIRRALMTLQNQSLSGVLKMDDRVTVEANYADRIVEILCSSKSAKEKYQSARQILANSGRRSFEGLYKKLYSSVESIASGGSVAQSILHIAEGMNNDALSIDKEINAMATIINLIND